MILVGLVLAFAGIWSIRLVVVAAGAGAAWLVADAFGATTATGLLVAAGGGLLAFLVGLLAANIVFFVLGAVVGAVLGAKLFAILETGESSVLLAAVFIPSVAVVGGVVMARWRERLVGWATAIAGSALVLSGLGVLAPDALGFLQNPGTAAAQVASTGLWVALAVAARLAQRTVRRTPGRS
jgi:hypothetical protein